MKKINLTSFFRFIMRIVSRHREAKIFDNRKIRARARVDRKIGLSLGEGLSRLVKVYDQKKASIQLSYDNRIVRNKGDVSDLIKKRQGAETPKHFADIKTPLLGGTHKTLTKLNKAKQALLAEIEILKVLGSQVKERAELFVLNHCDGLPPVKGFVNSLWCIGLSYALVMGPETLFNLNPILKKFDGNFTVGLALTVVFSGLAFFFPHGLGKALFYRNRMSVLFFGLGTIGLFITISYIRNEYGENDVLGVFNLFFLALTARISFERAKGQEFFELMERMQKAYLTINSNNAQIQDLDEQIEIIKMTIDQTAQDTIQSYVSEYSNKIDILNRHSEELERQKLSEVAKIDNQKITAIKMYEEAYGFSNNTSGPSLTLSSMLLLAMSSCLISCSMEPIVIVGDAWLIDQSISQDLDAAVIVDDALNYTGLDNDKALGLNGIYFTARPITDRSITMQNEAYIPAEQSLWFSNPYRRRQVYEQQVVPWMDNIDSMTKPSRISDHSYVFESLLSTVLTFRRHNIDQGRITLLSDGMQHSKILSFYRYNDLDNAYDEVLDLLPDRYQLDLSGISFRMVYNSTHSEDEEVEQSRRFWERFLLNHGATSVTFYANL